MGYLAAFIAGGTFGLLAAALIFAARDFIDDGPTVYRVVEVDESRRALDEFTLKDDD